MSFMIAIFLVLSFAIIFLFFYMFARDKAIDKKFHLLDAALENINQEIYKIQKQQQENSLQMEDIVSKQLDGILASLLENIRQAQYESKREIDLLQEQVAKLETDLKTRSLPDMRTLDTKKDNKEKAIELHNMGWSIEEIAKEIGMQAGEVQLLLKF